MKFRRGCGVSLFLAMGMITAFGQASAVRPAKSKTQGLSAPAPDTRWAQSGVITTSSNSFWTTTTGGAVWCDQISGCVISDPWRETRRPILPTPTISSVLKTAKLVSLEGQPAGHYLRAAKAVGFESPATDEAELLGAIKTHGLPVYDFAKVDEYLYNQALQMKAYTRWVWKPMRKEDLAVTGAERRQDGAGIIYPTVYAKAVPERVLEDIACLVDDAADLKLVFLVSDFEVLKFYSNDSATTEKLLGEGKIFIVEQWDEPGFNDGRPALVHEKQSTLASR